MYVSSTRRLNFIDAFATIRPNSHCFKMLPSPSSSPRTIFENHTNVPCTPIQSKSCFALPTPPDDRHTKRRAATEASGSLKKRAKLVLEEESDDTSDFEEYNSDSDVDMEDIALVRARARRSLPYQMRTRAATQPISITRSEARTCTF